MKPLIVGVDPGTTVGLAFVDLRGAPAGTFSSKNLSEGDVITRLREAGEPVIIASDKNPLPEMVSKLAANFSCRVFVPRKSLKVAEKKALTQPHSHGNAHERDALAAALKAYGTYSGKLRQLENRFGDAWEARVREVLLHETPLAEEPRVIIQKEVRVVEKAPEKYAEKIRDLEESLKRLKESLSGQKEIIQMQKKRLETLEHRKTGDEKKLETQLRAKERNIASLAKEKESLEKSLAEVLKAASDGQVAVVNLNSQVLTDKPFKTEKKMSTESKQVFDWCRSNEQPCTLVREIYREAPLVLVRVLESFEPRGKGWIHSIVEEYRKERKPQKA
ncbi:DUF460 domain-containing protein [Candidatus Micrarchaeota archaeon]|nr:DUF460 domain-containing protein [Candidatus Micrarchaeota archaeon]